MPAWQGRKPESDFRVRARIGGGALLVEGAAFTSNLKIRGDLPEAPSVATYPGVVYPWRRPEIKLEHETSLKDLNIREKLINEAPRGRNATQPATVAPGLP